MDSIQLLMVRLKEKYGEDRIVPYGTWADEAFGTGFRIAGVSATFSAITRDGEMAHGWYDVQFESYPPGDYLYTNVVDLDDLLRLIDKMTGPQTNWPSME